MRLDINHSKQFIWFNANFLFNTKHKQTIAKIVNSIIMILYIVYCIILMLLKKQGGIEIKTNSMFRFTVTIVIYFI